MYIMMYMRHVHVAFREEVLDELAAVAAEEQTSKSELIRAAVAAFLRQRARGRKNQAMKAYAERMAPQSGEFTELSDAAVVEQLLRETDW
jgi:metal-responsive CopG/Arc/MetJ family transcriptional regulator